MAVEQLLRRRRRHGFPASRQRTPQVTSVDAARRAPPAWRVERERHGDVLGRPRPVDRERRPLHARATRTATRCRPPCQLRRRAARRATLTPTAPLEHAAPPTPRGWHRRSSSDDETPLPQPYAWTFTTVPPDPPAVHASARRWTGPPTSARVTPVTASVLAADGRRATLEPSTFRLEGPGGAAVAAALDLRRRHAHGDAHAELRRCAPRRPTPRALSTGVASVQRLALSAARERGASRRRHARAACSATAQPDVTATGLDTRNGRSGPGPWTLEMGVKIRVVTAGPPRGDPLLQGRRRDRARTRGTALDARTAPCWPASRSGRDRLGLAAADARDTGGARARPDLRRLGRHQRSLRHDGYGWWSLDRLRSAAQRRGRRRTACTPMRPARSRPQSWGVEATT